MSYRYSYICNNKIKRKTRICGIGNMYSNVYENKDITHTQQCQAGVNIICKSDISFKIIEKWFTLTLTNPEFFAGDRRYCKFEKVNQFQGFRQHRHDQSVWSILCKLNKVNILKNNLNPINQTHYRE